jgi:SAM-dependent methyltransferase
VSGTFAVEDIRDRVLPGRVSDYLDTPVLRGDNLALLASREVLLEAMRDEAALPTTEAREDYYDERHLEYWLSGYRDALRAVEAARLADTPAPRILDFGGASGRVLRHMRYLCRAPELYLCEINPHHVELVRGLFGGAIRAFHSRGTPHLPFTDGFFDCTTAYSVFTHMYDDDLAWLLELRRITRPGGTVYVTIHDEVTWKMLPNFFLGDLTFSNAAFKSYYEQHPELKGKVAHFYTDVADYNCNVFVSHDYVERFWAPLFEGCEITSGAHEHQAGVVFRVPFLD